MHVENTWHFEVAADEFRFGEVVPYFQFASSVVLFLFVFV